MKITRVEAIPLSIPYQYGSQSHFPHIPKLDFCLVRVETDEGIVGWGDAFAYNCRSAVVAAVNDMIAPRALGHDASRISELGAMIQKHLHIFGRGGIQAYALSGLDIALWDIAAKAKGVPLHQLIGGAKRASMPCYASLLRYTEPAMVAKYCDQALGEGFRAIKLHEIADDAIAGARSAVPDDVPLMADVNCEWSPRDAIAAAERFKRFNLHWLEEPVFPPEDLASIRAVGEASGIPIAAGENYCYESGFKALWQTRAVTYAQPSVIKVGGITEFLKVADLGMKLAPHSPYFGPGALATLHLIAARAPEARFEYFYLWAEAGLFGDLLKPVNGELRVPAKPGLGMDPDPEVIRRFRA
ncbi:MAG TPA: mandelate racemase/muconate lactonizing enzyme family protein [Burkholderiales bacterium]|nr:mandelate racemase/muconate lactonizing enzyme family protein [Burkholderiales bacterium]